MNVGKGVGLQRKDKVPGTKPEPNPANRAHFGKCVKDGLNGFGDGLIDLYASDAHTMQAPAVSQVVCGAIVAWGGVSALIINSETSTTAAAGGDALQ